MPPQPKPLIDRFNAKVEKTETCWIWTAARIRKYGAIGIKTGQRPGYAHRVAYELYVGPIPDGMEIDHLCRNTLCVNPDHLEPVTPNENKRRAAAAVTHCPRGHEYDEENTYVYIHHEKGWTMRFCRACGREKKRERKLLRAA